MARLTKKDIEKLKELYEKGPDFTYDDLTPNLQNYADWFVENEEEIQAVSHRKEFAWYGGNSYEMAVDEVEKHNKPPNLSYNTKARVFEGDFLTEIINKIRYGAWN